MTEKEILEKLKQSAESVMIPESLAPDKILEKCRNLEQEKTGESREWRKKFLFGNPKLAGGLSAAAVFIICCISLWGMKNFEPESGMAEGAAAADTTMSSEACMMDEAAGGEAGAGESAAQEGGADAGAKVSLMVPLTDTAASPFIYPAVSENLAISVVSDIPW